MATEIHRWRMEEGSIIVDQVGSANGTINGTPAKTVGILDDARYFAINDYIDCGNPSDINFSCNVLVSRFSLTI